MNNAPAYFEIQVDDCARAIKFYSEVFGWEFTKVEGLPIEYFQIRTATYAGGLLKAPVSKPTGPQGTNAYTCSVEVADFDATAAKIAGLGGMVAMAKFAIPGKCWQGYFIDSEGNVFGIFQVDEKAA